MAITSMQNFWMKIHEGKTPGTIPVLDKFWQKFNKNDLLLEVGCGWGRILYQCVERDLKVVGIDINKKEISGLKDKLKKDKKKFRSVNIFNKNILNTGFKDEKFDGVLMQGILAGMKKEDRILALEQVFKLLKKGGYLHIGEFKLNKHDSKLKKIYEKDYPVTKEYGTFSVKNEDGNEMFRTHHFRVDEIYKLVRDAGFNNINIEEKIFISYHGNERVGILILSRK